MSAAIGGVLRWATTKVDENVVSPVANRLAGSVANPYVLSYFIWDRIKRMTPQRARDLTRLLSTAIGNAVGVLGAEQAHQLRSTTRQLQEEVVDATASTAGREVLMNTVATLSKTAQALNTPETKAATQQAMVTLQSVIDFFASSEGRKIISTAGQCLNRACEVAASPESSIFLAEIATNVCHALEAEVLRKEEAKVAKAAAEIVRTSSQGEVEEGETEAEACKSPASPTSSRAETQMETDSHGSEIGGQDTGSALRRQVQLAGKQRELKLKSAYRSARIEKEVLLRMGVDPSMLSEIQRVLDTLQEEEEAKARRVTEDTEQTSMAMEDVDVTDGEDEDVDDLFGEEEDENVDDHRITRAFGLRTADAPEAVLEADEAATTVEAANGPTEQEDATSPARDVLLPEWHTNDTRAALRRRHGQAQSDRVERSAFMEQSRQIAAILHERQMLRESRGTGPVDLVDRAMCRVISNILVYSFLLLALAAMLLGSKYYLQQ